MDAYQGIVRASDDAFQKRFMDFFVQLSDDDSSIAWGVTAHLIYRANDEQIAKMSMPLQRKLIEASKQPCSTGIAHFTIALLKRYPKMLSHNTETVRKIVHNLVDFAFTAMVEQKNDSAVKPVYSLFAATFGQDITQLLNSIASVSKGNPPYKNPEIVEFKILNEYGKKMKQQLLAFLWGLVEACISFCPKSLELNVEHILKVAQHSFSSGNEKPIQKIFDTLIAVTKRLGGSFIIFLPLIYGVITNFEIPAKIVHNFLYQIGCRYGSLAHLPLSFPNILTQYASSLQIPKEINTTSNLPLGRKVARELSAKIAAEAELLSRHQIPVELVIKFIETGAMFVPVHLLGKIQRFLCMRILYAGIPSADDLCLLNTFLALNSERLPSPLQVARTVYANSVYWTDPELSRIAVVGRALCNTLRSSRIPVYPLVPAREMPTSVEEDEVEIDVDELSIVNVPEDSTDISRKRPAVDDDIIVLDDSDEDGFGPYARTTSDILKTENVSPDKNGGPPKRPMLATSPLTKAAPVLQETPPSKITPPVKETPPVKTVPQADPVTPVKATRTDEPTPLELMEYLDDLILP